MKNINQSTKPEPAVPAFDFMEIKEGQIWIAPNKELLKVDGVFDTNVRVIRVGGSKYLCKLIDFLNFKLMQS